MARLNSDFNLIRNHLTYFTSLYKICQHDNFGNFLLPNHPPEVSYHSFVRALGGNVRLRPVVAL